ncbi:hypothetical protein ACFYT4_28315 [Streptomyces sp. NPDC004609]|uniref:hypothetical protein n=1 Tax=Streptomyces sp. NPDC004609 TaxID=3364704 RepID=UPI003676BCCB
MRADWGTPSWGPLLFDVVSWQLFLASHRPPGTAAGGGRRLADAYRGRFPLDDLRDLRDLHDHEPAARRLMAGLHHAIQDAWRSP